MVLIKNLSKKILFLSIYLGSIKYKKKNTKIDEYIFDEHCTIIDSVGPLMTIFANRQHEYLQFNFSIFLNSIHNTQ